MSSFHEIVSTLPPDDFRTAFSDHVTQNFNVRTIQPEISRTRLSPKSLDQLSFTTMPETAGEYVDIPALLKGILNGYPGNSAIFREYLQNSDDARASKQIFVLDERIYPSESLIDKSLKGSQGPALVAINDGVLDPADWKALQKIHSSSKIADESRTGKNGLGFRASYHLTENPHILSGHKLLILDAHRKFNPHAGGVSIDTITEGTEYEDQLSPFLSYVDTNPIDFQGTLFRLPLRTQNQADTSRIKDTPTLVPDIRELLYSFCANELEEVCLFLKHVTSIEVKHIHADGREVHVGTVEVERMPLTVLEGSRTLYHKVAVTNHEGTTTTRVWCHHVSPASRTEALEEMRRRLGYAILDEKLHTEKLVPGVELAFPLCGASTKGRLYTLLPLPISTGFSLHINAVFALSPDRQSLKNLLEIGGSKSRERLLVEWNKAIFDVCVPRAWAELLTNLAREAQEASEQIEPLVSRWWSLWPPLQLDNTNLYSFCIARRVVEETLRRCLAVFPSATRNKVNLTSFISLYDPSVLLAEPEPGISIDVLSSLDIDVVHPPSYLFEMILSFSRLFKAEVLKPKSLYTCLRKRYSETTVPPLDVGEVHIVTDYLASLASPIPTVSYIAGIPWFLCSDSSTRAALASHSTKYIAATREDECALFSTHPHMLAWDSMSASLRSRVAHPSNFGVLNVTTLRPDDILLVLLTKFRHLKPPLPQITQADHTWLVQFWTWMHTYPRMQEFMQPNGQYLRKCAELYILPTAERSLRRVSAKTFVFSRTEEAEAVEAWRLLHVCPLYEGLVDGPAKSMKPLVEWPKMKGYVPLLIHSCQPHLGQQAHLSQEALFALQKSLFNGLPSSTKAVASSSSSTRVVLDSVDRSTLATMHVFKLRTRNGDATFLGSIRGQSMFVKVPSGFPIPVQPGEEDIIFVDMTDESTVALAQLVYIPFPKVYTEPDIIQIAFDHWQIQTVDIQDRLIKWFFDNLSTVPHDLRARLAELPFVSVENVEERVRPVGLIDPTSPLRNLYVGEPGKFPTGPFANEYLSSMRILRFVHARLDDVILKERLDHLARTNNTTDQHRFEKAKFIVDECNKSWDAKFDSIISHMRARPWMPFDSSSPLLSPNECRDILGGRGMNEDPFFYDLALKILPSQIQISSSDFRSALGWTSTVRSEILVNQFKSTVDLDLNHSLRNTRLNTLINYLGLLHHEHRLSSAVVDELVGISSGRTWIPIANYGNEVIGTDFAVLASDVELKPPFHHVGHFRYTEFLEEMGCSQHPKLDVLTHELSKIDFSAPKGISASIAILQAIADHYPSFDPSSILVPGENDEGLPLHLLYFRDIKMQNLSGGMTDLVSAHKAISRGLAESLGIPFLSAIILEDSSFGGQDDEAEEEEQMSEDFVNRIQGFLREYDIRYAMNEFLANADDAHATEFSILLDTPTIVGERFLSPTFQRLAGASVLVLYNNAKFSEDDFKGLKHVGMGGKRDRTNTHGRHGVGALSFYYFTDVVTVISGEDVMFLDPSGENLPPSLRRGKRTALKRKISQLTRQFPDQLRVYDSLFNFNAHAGFFEGTLFILPLKTTISSTPCTQHDVHDMIKATYRSLSENAFFFTELNQISAKERTTTGDRLIWSLSATRSAEVSTGDGLTRRQIKLEHSTSLGSLKEEWLIVTSPPIVVPEEHQATAAGLKIVPGSSTHIELAMRIDNAHVREVIPRSSLFSTLSLPKPTSLPFHINARFAISSNRQNIVIIPSGSDTQVDPKTAYNVWILKDVVPPLYLSALHDLVHDNPTSTFYHDRWWLLQSNDDISKFVRDPFLQKLAESDKELFQDFGHRWIPFRDAVFSYLQPEPVTRVLRSAKIPRFVLHEHLTKLSGAKVVDGEFVASALALPEGRQAILDMYSANTLERGQIAQILEYVRNVEEIKGLPLLVLSSHVLVGIPDIQETAVYRSASLTVTSLFSHGRFLAPIYTIETEKRLISDEALNVLDLMEANLIKLIHKELTSRDYSEKKVWLENFWRAYPELPGPPGLQALEDYGYPMVLGSSRILPLSSCTQSEVVYHISRRPPLTRSVLETLRKFDLEIVSLENHTPLEEFLSPRFLNSLTNVLRCLEAKGVTNFQVLEEAESKQFASWIRENIGEAIVYWANSKPQSSLVQYLLRLPFWPAQSHQGEILHSLSGLKFLPASIPAQTILPYQKRGIIVTPLTPNLTRHLEYIAGNIPKSLSAKAITQVVDIPDPVDPAGLALLYSFITAMLVAFPVNELLHAELKVPDIQGNLRRIDELYDSTNPLFSTTLAFTARPSFVHPTFQDLQPRLYMLGLIHEVNPSSFQTCLQEISRVMELHEAGHFDRDTLLRISNVAFSSYQTTIPSMIMVNAHWWAALDGITFVRRKEVRRTGAAFDVGRYFERELPLLQPPSRLVRQSCEAIAWSQRGLFHEEPSEAVLAVNKMIGVPTVNEVVEHLKFLATKIAPDHPGDVTLLNDLKATYAWLNDHSQVAQEALVLAADVPFFLNVDDPTVNPWPRQWIHARGMVLHLHYECGGLKRVHRFLGQYPNLLAVAGSVTLKSFERGPREEPTVDARAVSDDLRATFDAMRKAGELTDVALVPSTLTEERDVAGRDPIAPTDPGLRAHLSFLSAMIPHVRQSAQGWLVNSTGRIPFYGSTFGAKALLEFAYTGNFKCSAPTTEPDDLASLMTDLLELLPIADEWDMPHFKRLLEYKIIHKYNMIQRLPHQYDTMLEQAQRYKANTLTNALVDFKKENEEFLRVVNRGENSVSI